MKRRAQIRMSTGSLAKLLHLGETLMVTNVQHDPEDDTVRIYVEGPSLPEISDGNCARNYNVTELMLEFE